MHNNANFVALFWARARGTAYSVIECPCLAAMQHSLVRRFKGYACSARSPLRDRRRARRIQTRARPILLFQRWLQQHGRCTFFTSFWSSFTDKRRINSLLLTQRLCSSGHSPATPLYTRACYQVLGSVYMQVASGYKYRSVPIQCI